MLRSILFACLALAATVVSGAPAQAILAETLRLSAADRADLIRIDEHLNSIKTMESRFLQVSSSGEYSEGQIHLSRPGRMRIQYDPPSPMLVIADGVNLIYIDQELDSATSVFLALTPADLLLREYLPLASEDIIVTGFQRKPGVLSMSVIKADSVFEGNLTLVFSDKPLELRKWAVTDAQGIVTTVSLLGPRFGGSFDKKLFEYDLESDPTQDN